MLQRTASVSFSIVMTFKIKKFTVKINNLDITVMQIKVVGRDGLRHRPADQSLFQAGKY